MVNYDGARPCAEGSDSAKRSCLSGVRLCDGQLSSVDCCRCCTRKDFLLGHRI